MEPRSCWACEDCAAQTSAIWGLFMKLAGFFLLLAGWVIVLTALALLPSAVPRAAFVTAGVGVEILGFALVARSRRGHPQEGW